MKCPKCGKTLIKISHYNNGNYTKNVRICKKCKYKTTSYEFLAEDLPDGFLQKGQRVLIGDSLKNLVPAIYLHTSSLSTYPYIVIDNDGEMIGKTVVKIKWGRKE